ncbi:MAG: glycosyltransferase family 4 protein [Clostridia bacterium]|nr:glycosyltransferase family 4 protein [Clostridia bacterium]
MKTEKLLYILNVANRVNNFSYTSMLAARGLGIEYHIAGNWSYSSDEERIADEKRYGIRIHQIDFARNPCHPQNLRAYFQLRALIKNENYDAIHCNTPIGGMLGRIVGRQRKIEKIIYQAHGFHFYEGAPRKNRLIYYNAEALLARFTDALITINREDYEAAKRFKLKNGGKVFFVHGVGVALSEYDGLGTLRAEKRAELGLADTDIALISMGDLVARKNYGTAIRAVAKANNKNLHYLICGKGPEFDALNALAIELGVEGQIHFLGFRTDIKELLSVADVFLFTTLQEGLPRSMMEAMASGLPCVASKIRGNVDLIEDGVGGYLRAPNDVDGFAEAILKIVSDDVLRAKMRECNLETIKRYDVSVVEQELREIYSEVLN